VFTSILSFFGSAAFGGLTGLFGVIAGKVGDYFTLKQKNAFDLAMRDKDMAIAQIEATKEVTIALDTNNANREIAESKMIESTQSASYEADKAEYLTHDIIEHAPTWASGIISVGLGIVDFVRGMTRPGLTLYLCILTTLMYYQMESIVTASSTPAFTSADAVKIIVLIVDAVIYLTTVCVTWWFGSRSNIKK
jgi:hypothetical protein